MATRLFGVAVVSAFLAWSPAAHAQDGQAQEKKGSAPPTTGKAPAEQKSAPKTAPQKEAGAAAKGHVLQGEWKVYWISDDRTTQMKVVEATQIQTGLTNFIGAIGTPTGDGCSITGTVVDNLNGQFAEGIEVRTAAILSYVIAHASCPREQLWLEAFGLPTGKILMSGRATFIAPDGARRYAAVALGR
jgi:hypothetical protein